MSNKSASLLIAGLLIWMVLAALWGIPRLTPHTFHGTLLQSPSVAHDFTLTSNTGQKVSLSDFRGKLVLLYFGYTFCPDVCPTTLAEISNAMKILGKNADDVQIIMISVDPERDTPALLAEYVAHFDPRFLGVTGTPEEIAEIATLYGIFYQKNEGSNATGYLVDHTATITVVDQYGHVKLVFPFGTRAKDMADDLAYLLKH
jgi:protein SCO1/2